MADFLLWLLVEMLSAFISVIISAWTNSDVPRGYLVGTLVMSLGLPVLARPCLIPSSAPCAGVGTGLAWAGFIAVLVIGNRDHEKSPGA